MTYPFSRISFALDELTRIKGSLGYLLIIVVLWVGYMYTNHRGNSDKDTMHPKATQQQPDVDVDDELPDPPRNFTQQQLAYFDGKTDDRGDEKPVYFSVNCAVFDVSNGRNFYGPGGPYEAFAGHECGKALAKMCFDTECLDDFDLSQLNFGERTELEGWIDKFTHYRNYPIKGKLVPDNVLFRNDPNLRVFSHDDLKPVHDGTIPEGYATPPIYIGAGDKVYDVSFGGVTFYGPGGPYCKFSGKDASRALAKMSLDDADLATSDISDLTDKQIGILADWIKTFSERKMYPVVGRLHKK